MSAAVCSSCAAGSGGDDDVGAGLGEGERDRASDAAAAAGDDDRPTHRVVVIVVFVVSRGVIARVLLEVGQRFEALHAIEEQHAVEMIGLVLDDARGEILQLELEALAVAIERRHLDVLRARHAAAHFGNAQAAFPALDRLIADHDGSRD